MRFGVWCVLFLLTRRCVSSPRQVCRSFPSCQLAQACSRVSQRVVCEEGKSLKLNLPVCWLTLALIATKFRWIHNEGLNVSARRVRGGTAPSGEPEQEQLLALQFLMTPDPTSSVMCTILLSCSLHFCSSFIVYYGMNSLFQKQTTGSSSLPNCMHIKPGSPKRRRP